MSWRLPLLPFFAQLPLASKRKVKAPCRVSCVTANRWRMSQPYYSPRRRAKNGVWVPSITIIAERTDCDGGGRRRRLETERTKSHRQIYIQSCWLDLLIWRRRWLLQPSWLQLGRLSTHTGARAHLNWGEILGWPNEVVCVYILKK